MWSVLMRTVIALVAAGTFWSGALVAQEQKPVPKDSARLSIPGCTKGYIFTAGRRSVDEPSSLSVPEGLHFRMNGPKKVMAEIKAHEGSMIQIIGLMKKGQQMPDGVAVGGGVRITAGPAPTGGGAGQIFIDIESWRPILGSCPSH